MYFQIVSSFLQGVSKHVGALVDLISHLRRHAGIKLNLHRYICFQISKEHQQKDTILVLVSLHVISIQVRIPYKIESQPNMYNPNIETQSGLHTQY